MKKANRLLLLFGVLLAGFGGLALFLYLQSLSLRQVAAQQVPPVNILVATTDIPAFKPITSDMLQVQQVPGDTVTPDNARDVSAVVGKAVRTHVKQGQQILTSTLTDVGFSYAVPKDRRAMAIAVNQLSVLNGLLKEGDHVDVVFIGTFPQVNVSNGKDGRYAAPADSGSTVKTMVQDVEVLKVMQPGVTVSSPESAPTSAAGAPGASQPAAPISVVDGSTAGAPKWTVVLAVTEQQAETIQFGSSNGTLSLALRATGDTSTEQTTGITQDILNQGGVPLPVQPKQK